MRIADTARVRLGAHLSPGTTVLHEGFCNFNAGTLGASMVEGRISAGVIVDDGSDIGGGASIMGTMSGGGKQVVSIGKRCLLGANSGIGISLGDDCVVEAGCYHRRHARAHARGRGGQAVSLAGQHGLLFRRNSQTGAVETLVRTAAWGTLNPALHSGHSGRNGSRRRRGKRQMRFLANQARRIKQQASGIKSQASGARRDRRERKMPQLAARAISAVDSGTSSQASAMSVSGSDSSRKVSSSSAAICGSSGYSWRRCCTQVLWNSVRDSRSLE